MKNITITVGDDLYRRVQAKAAGRGTSVSAVVREFLIRWAGEERDFDGLKRLQDETLQTNANFRARDRLSRDAIHRRTS